MDLTSYLLGKNSSSGGGGGGGDLSEYFNTEITSNTDSSTYLKLENIVKKTPPLTLDETVTNLSYAFRYFPNVELDFSQFDTKNVTNISNMFVNSQLEKIDISNFDTTSVVTSEKPFENCSKLKELICNNLKFKTKFVTLEYLFDSLYKIAKLDISLFDLTEYTPYYFSNMFTNCGLNCLQSDGAYANGIPYVYVKDATVQNWVLTANNGHPSSWTTDNVIVKQ